MAINGDIQSKQSHSKQNHEDISNNNENEELQAQLIAIERIRKCKDYYEILSVNKNVDELELRKQYKKLALQFHPDKNKIPGAADAFKAISTAFSVLNDPEKRKEYDLYGIDATNKLNAQDMRSSMFEGDVTPEELFNMFFSGGQTYVRRENQWFRTTRTFHQDDQSIFLQILPLVLIITISFLSQFFVSEPPYSLHQSTKYLYEQRTRNLDVPYYVKENFQHVYHDRLSKIEEQVEEEYLFNIRSSCFRERNYKENAIWRAKHFKDINLERKAKELRLPSCDILNDLLAAMKK